MKTPRAILVSCMTLTLVGGFVLLVREASAGPRASGARLVTASIAVDGRVVLRASTSDDGHPDADEVWGYLLGQLEFKPTEAFSALGVDPASERVTLGWRKSPETEARGEPPSIELTVSHGGRDAPFELGLVRNAGEANWRVANESVRDRFPHRWITRVEAAQLTAPRRSK